VPRSRILAIETSCDETAAAVVGSDSTVLCSVVRSQVAIHGPYGGVVPELASREHTRFIVPIVDAAMTQSQSTASDIAAVAVTQGPGLVGCLAVGISTAKALALAWQVPIVAVNHLEGHIFSAELDLVHIEYPAVILLVSGGHTILIDAPNRGEYVVLGETRDDSIGEAYDKVARELGLGYPGGPIIDRLSSEGHDTYAFPRPMIHDGFEFSFSGLKTAVRRRLLSGSFDPRDVAASFSAACGDVLVEKLSRAINEYKPRTAIFAGGVAASPILRDRLRSEVTTPDVELVFPQRAYSTDNAAMIGAAAWFRLDTGGASDPSFGPEPNIKLRIPSGVGRVGW
jgi:N6-L-threonylcarbamoyladenine synthase